MEYDQKTLKSQGKGKTLKEKADELMKIEGNMRGELLKNNFLYLKEKEGEGAVKTMEDKLREIGYPLELKDINTYGWYKDPYCGVFMLIFQEVFGWNDQQIFDLGKFSPRYSMIMKLAFRYLLSVKRSFEYSQKLWRTNVDYGDMEHYKIDEKKKYLIYRLKNYKLNNLVCIYIKGYLTSLFDLIIGKDRTIVEETSCTFKGDPYHEYKISWI